MEEIKDINPKTSHRALKTEEIPINEISNNNLNLENHIIKRVLKQLEKKTFKYKPIDTYANSIPFGSSALAMICITYGFGIANLYPINSLIYAQLFLQSSFGVVLAGYLEYIKGRNALVIMYIFTGFFFFIQFFILYFDPFNYVVNYDNNCWTAYFCFWTLAFFVVTMCTLRTNIIITLYCGLMVIYALLSFIGYWSDSKGTVKVSGGFLVSAGFVSYYLATCQLISTTYKKNYLPCFPYMKNNGIDIDEE